MNHDDTIAPSNPGSSADQNWQTLHTHNATEHDLKAQVSALLTVVRNLAQETAVLRKLLLENTPVDGDEYRRRRLQRIIDDHSSLGIAPERAHSLYEYTLHEEAFMAQALQMSGQERSEARQRIRQAKTMS